MNHHCGYCGNIHLSTKCPLVKAMEWYENGIVKRVEFYSEQDYKNAGGISYNKTFVGEQP